PSLVEVREVAQDAQAVAGTNALPARGGQPRPRVRRAREAEWHPLRERVGAAPDQAERTQPGPVEDLQGVELGVDGLGTLEVEDGRNGAAGQTGPQLGRILDDFELAVRLP